MIKFLEKNDNQKYKISMIDIYNFLHQSIKVTIIKTVTVVISITLTSGHASSKQVVNINY